MKLVTNIDDQRPAIAKALLPEQFPFSDYIIVKTEPLDFLVGVSGHEIDDERRANDCHFNCQKRVITGN